MNFSAEVKFIGDEYMGFYSCGISMLGSATMRDFTKVKEDEEKILYINSTGVELKVSKELIEDTEATAVVTSITNNSRVPFKMEMLTSFMVSGIKADNIYRIMSFWSEEGKVKVDKLSDLGLEMSWNHMAFRNVKFGTNGSMPVRQYFPFVALEDSENGKFTAVQLYSPSSWQLEVSIQHEETYTISGGIGDRDFGHWSKVVNPGETFVAPKAVVAEGNSLLEVCDKLVKSQRPDISPVDNEMGITFNEYCTTWGNPTIENLKKICDKIADKKIQYLVMDSGWYLGPGEYWWELEGDWEVNKERFPNGLKELTSYIRSKGMVPGIWFEFEVASFKTKTFNEEDHLLKKDGVPLTVGGRRYLDMEDPWAEDFLTKKVIGNLKENDFGYIKVDYNDTLGFGVDGNEAMAENLRRKVIATQNFFRKMREEIPGLVIENCSSGGHRLEPSMMELSSQASFSDAHEILSLPLIAANHHRVIRPDQSQIWAVMRKEDPDERIFYSLCATFLGRMGLSGDIYDLSDHQWQLIDEGISFYKEVSEIIKNGTTVVLEADTKRYDKPNGSQLVVRSFEDKALVVFHRFEDSMDLEEFVEAKKLSLDISKAVKTYGKADKDFSACAILLKK